MGVPPDVASDRILLLILLVVSPLLLKTDLYALRHTCYVGFCSLIFLLAAVVNQAYTLNVVSDRGAFERGTYDGSVRFRI